MNHVQIGSDTYGRVKQVGSTPIVTKFFMVSLFPVLPLESFYLIRLGESTSEGIPFIAQAHWAQIEGIPLAQIDKLSVVMAYARGVLGAVAIAGFMGTFTMFITWLTGEPIDDEKRMIVKCTGACLVIGTAVGLSTYLFPLQMTRREKEIRKYCGTILGISADPAQVRLDFANSMDHHLRTIAVGGELANLAHDLACTRVRIALGDEPLPLEDHTDDLLTRIEIQESTST
jgi:hypothetical protein